MTKTTTHTITTETILAARAGDEPATLAILERMRPLLVRLVSRYRFKDQEDLHQVATLAVLEAVQNFDTTKGTSFTTYATQYAAGALTDEAGAASGVGPTIPKKTRARYRAALDLAGGDLALAEELAGEMSLSRETFTAVHTAMTGFVGIEDEEPETEDPMDALIDRLLVQDLMSRLPEGHREVVRLGFWEELDQAAIAARLGVSQPTVSRRIREALALLRDLVTA